MSGKIAVLCAAALFGLCAASGAAAKGGEPDVYVLGKTNGSVPCYWKNGEQILFAGLDNNADAFDIAVSGNDVYVAGFYNGSGGYDACYWKNDQRIVLSSGSAMGVAVSGNDVYVAGYNWDNWDDSSGTIAGYWKNGQWNALSKEERSGGLLEGIAVSGNDVYLLGHHGKIPCYWKNGQRFDIVGANFDSSDGRYWAVSGNDVYFAVENLPYYWKNAKPFPAGENIASIAGITVSGKDVYVLGKSEYRGSVSEADSNGKVTIGMVPTASFYWKNGKRFDFIGKEYNRLGGICVWGSDVYVAGVRYDGTSKTWKVCYWKNFGLPVYLPNAYTNGEGTVYNERGLKIIVVPGR